MSSTYTVLIVGASRGLGLGLAQLLSTRPNHNIIGTARDPSKASTLASLPNTKVLTLDISSPSSISAFALEAAKAAPEGIDELWINAGVSQPRLDPPDVPHDLFLSILNTNVCGPHAVVCALFPLLQKKANGGKKVVFLSSNCGSRHDVLDRMALGYPTAMSQSMAYATSKYALNMCATYWWNHLKRSEEGWKTVLLHPGCVRTEMGGSDAELSVEESCEGMVKVADGVGSGDEFRMWRWDGKVMPW